MRNASLTFVLGAAASLALPQATNAVGFGRVVSQATLGQPLDFVVSVHVDADEPNAGDCATAKVMFGDATVSGENLRVSFEAARSSGERRVRVATLGAVDEPIVTVDITLGCTSQVTRRFVAFADPPVVRLAVAEIETRPIAAADDAMPALSPLSRALDLGRRADGSTERSAARRAPPVERQALRRTPREPRVASSQTFAPRQPTRAGSPDPVVATSTTSTPRQTTRLAAPAQIVAGSRAGTPRQTTRVASAGQAAAAPGTSAPRLRLEATTALGAPPARSASASALASAALLAAATKATVAPAAGQSSTTPATAAQPAAGPTQAATTQAAPMQAPATPVPGAAATLAATTAATAGTTPIAPSAEALAQDRIQALEAGIARMRSDAQSQQKTIGALQARVREAEGDRYANGVVYALVAVIVALGLLAALLWAIRPRQRRRARWFDGHSKLPLTVAPSVESAHPPAPTVVAAEPEPVPSRPSPLISDFPSSITRPASTASTYGGVEVTTIIEPDAHLPSADAPSASGAAVQRGAAASMEELIDLEQQAEFFIVLGQDDAAIALLDAQVGSAGTSPLPYLQLLEVHQRRGDELAYERIRQAFHERFGAFAPEWTADLQLGRGLEHYPETIARLQALWATPLQAMQTLDSLLLRRSASDETFDFPAYRELLFLYSIARELAGNVETDFGAIDLFLPLDEEPPSAVSAAAPLHEIDLDLDFSSWEQPAEGGQAVVVRRSVGRH